MDARWLDRNRLMVLIAVAVAARAVTFGNPLIHVDEDFYFAAARLMADGAVPYVDVWDRKPIGLFVLYLVPASLPFGWGIIAYQLMALAAVVTTAWIVARLAMLAGWGRGATYAGILYFLWLNLADGQAGQAPILYNPLVAGAAWLIVTNTRRRSWWQDAAAMALMGLALQVKYSVVFEGVFFGLWILVREWRAGVRPSQIAARAGVLAAIALLPTLAVMGYYAAIGQFDAFLYANFESIIARQADPPRERWGNLAKLVLILSPLMAMALVSARRSTLKEASERRFMLCWFAAALLGILVLGGWFDHYALPAAVPGAVCAAGFLETRPRGRIAVLLSAALIGQVLVIANRVSRGNGRELAAITASIGAGPGCLWVYSGSPKIYATANRCHVTRYLFPSHLYRTREDGAIGVPQTTEVARILRRGPEVIVMRPPSIGERRDIRAMVERAVGADYVVAARHPLGNEVLTIYQRR